MHTRPELEGSIFRFGAVSQAFSNETLTEKPGPGLPLTPAQEELISLINAYKEPTYLSFRLPILEHVFPSIDLI